jgi:hypothetical protein
MVNFIFYILVVNSTSCQLTIRCRLSSELHTEVTLAVLLFWATRKTGTTSKKCEYVPDGILNIKSKKSKAVPLHAMEALGGRGGIAPTHSRPRHYMGVSGQHHAPAALYPRGKDPGTHCTGDWVGPRAGLDTEARGKILCPRRGSNPLTLCSKNLQNTAWILNWTDWIL